MVKTRRDITEIHFDQRAPLAEVVQLRELVMRDQPVDLRLPQRPLFHHLYFVTRGPGVHTVDFQRHRLVPGSVLHVAPGQVQQFGLQRTLDAKLVVFEPELLGRRLPPWPRPRLLTGDQQRMASELIATLARAKMTVRSNRRLFAALVDAIVAVIDDGAQVADDLYARFLVALEREHARTREVAAYAAILKCSSRTLGRACARATRKTVKQVIDERVALEARRLLAHGSEPAAAVGARLGFCEPTQFGKFFRRICGTTPDAFRKRFRVTPRR